MSRRQREVPPLPAERPGTLEAAVEAVAAAWDEHETLAARSRQDYAQQVRRFAVFAAACGVTTLDAVTSDLVAAFVDAPSRRHGADTVKETTAPMRAQRRIAVFTFYRAVCAAGWAAENPVWHVSPPHRDLAPVARPLTDDEAAGLRFHAGDNPAGSRATIVALALCGAFSTESAALAIADVDLGRRTARLPGTNGHRARSVPLDEHAAQILAARARWLSENEPDAAMLCWRTPPSSTQCNVKATQEIRKAVVRAGLGEDPSVTPASLALTAARRVLEATGRIEAAARLLGARSLDAVAKTLRWKWDTLEADGS